MRRTHALHRTTSRAASRRAKVLLAVFGATVGLGIVGTGVAFGYWETTDPSNPAQAVASSLPQGATPSASLSATSYDTVTITFGQVTTTSGGVEIPVSHYVLQRYPSAGGPPVTVTASCSGTGTITCTESSVPDGTWRYTDTPTYATNWVGVESAKSGVVTVNTTPTVSVTYPVDGTIYGSNWTGPITGTASSVPGTTIASTKVAIEDNSTTMWWNGTAFAASTQTFVPVTGNTTWLRPLAASNLTSGDSYSVVAQATDSAGNLGTSSTVSFTYGTATAPPTVSVTYPVNNTTYGSNWSGEITGTASAAIGASITSISIAVEDTAAKLWWNGTSFSATKQTFEPVTSGTTTWLLTLQTSNLTSGHTYSVIAEATDSAGNLGTSSTVSFTYGTTTTATTPPTVSVTYPVDGTSYGSNWTGTIIGTASSNSGASTTITSTEVAIEDTSTTMWWNRTAFAASTQTFVPVTGTTTWLLAMPASNLTSGNSYSVIAQATDSAGNVGTSSTVTFTDTAPPTTTTTPPTTTTTTTQPPTTTTTTPPTTTTTTTQPPTTTTTTPPTTTTTTTQPPTTTTTTPPTTTTTTTQPPTTTTTTPPTTTTTTTQPPTTTTTTTTQPPTTTTTTTTPPTTTTTTTTTPPTYAETTGSVAYTWTDYQDAGGTEGPEIEDNQTVQITCRASGWTAPDGNNWWYEIASAPWSNSYWVSADAFYNNGETSGPLTGTPFYDSNVPVCGDGP